MVSLAKTTTVQDAVGQLLAQLGYQPLPAERPVIIHDGGVAFEAKGQWAVMAPQQSNRPQEIIVINLANGSGEISEELKTHLSAKGLHLKNVSLKRPETGESTGEKAEAIALKGQANKFATRITRTGRRFATGLPDFLRSERESGSRIAERLKRGNFR